MGDALGLGLGFFIGLVVGLVAAFSGIFLWFEHERQACAQEHNVFACQQVIEYRPLPATHDEEGK